MKKFILEQPYLDIFPESKIGILVCTGIDNHIVDENKYVDYLQEAQKEAMEEKRAQTNDMLENYGKA